MRFAFKCYFRKIIVTGVDHIPKEGPILFLCNHPSSFTEPMLLACFQDRILNFLVRGDLFENRFLKPILEGTYQIPIYRARDGFENLRKNKSTFDRVHQKLNQSECVLIFPESTTHWVRHLRPLQKGAAHIAINSVIDHNLKNLIVIPCGTNYTNVLRAGSDVLINIGKPILIQEWLKQKSESSDLPSELTSHFTLEMEKVVFSVPPKISTTLYDQLMSIKLNESTTHKTLLEFHQNLINSLKSNSSIIEKYAHKITYKISELESIAYSISTSISLKIKNLLKTIINFMVGIPALILFGPWLILFKRITYKIVKTEFIPPIRILFSIVIVFLFSLAFLFYFGLKYNFIIGFAISLFGLISLRSMLYFIYNFKFAQRLFSIKLMTHQKDYKSKLSSLLDEIEKF